MPDLAAYLPGKSKGGGHWYHPDGRACHTVPYAGKREGERPTTLTDARKMGLLPSSTGILGVLEKGGLLRWGKFQTLLKVLKHPIEEHEDVDLYFNRIEAMAAEVLEEAADFGTDVHKAIEDYYNGEGLDPEHQQYVTPVIEALDAVGYEARLQEKRVVNMTQGYAGTCDGLGSIGDHFAAIDFKTRKSKNGKFSVYETDRWQLASYGVAYYGEGGVDDIVTANVYISKNEPGVVQVVIHEDTATSYEAFCHCAAIWRIKNRYDPRANLHE